MTNEVIAVLTVPLILSLLIGVATELTEIAESASDKVINYAEDMENALDCAFVGIPIEVCSPNLVQTDFKQDLKDLNATNAELIQFYEQYADQLAELNDTALEG
jgi:hypothetical protein